jgi:outer membrane autotransporter protein
MGGGRADMLQAAIYSSTRIHAAYVSAALAYSWQDVTTDQYLSVINLDRLTANFKTNSVGGRIEGGYRFGIPGFYETPSFGITPYAALQGQAYFTPAYSENATSVFARSFDARTATVYRTELGAWFDTSRPFYNDSILTLRSRAAWAHDEYSGLGANANFVSLPGFSFSVNGVTPAHDLLLASAGAELRFPNRVSVGAQFDSEFAERATKYSGKGVVRYSW